MDKHSGTKIVSLKNYKNRNFLEHLRELPDTYEYLIVPDYEDKFSDFHTECIQMDDCFATLLENGDHYVLVSILFNKDWGVQEIVNWMERYHISLFPKNTESIEVNNAASIVEAKRFKGYPLVLSEKGGNSVCLNPFELIELTEEYQTYQKITNTGMAKPVGWSGNILDKDDCLDRTYPGVAEEDADDFSLIRENVQYSDAARGLFMQCDTCHFESVNVHFREFEVVDPFCPSCGNKITNCMWVNGPL